MAGVKRHKTRQQGHISTTLGWLLGLFWWVESMNFFVLVVCKWAPQGQGQFSPCPPRVPRPLAHPPEPSPSLVQVRRLFGNFFLACWGIPAPKGQNIGCPHLGRHRRGTGPERCGPVPPTSTLDGPISGLVGHGILGDIFLES